MAEDVNLQEEAEQRPTTEDQTGEADAADILDQAGDEVEELEEEQIEWTEDMMPKFETPPLAGPEQTQTTAQKDTAGVAEEHAEEADKPGVGSGTSASSPADDVKSVRFPQFAPSPKGDALGNLDLLLDVKMPLIVELGRSRMLIRDILELGPGSVIELDKAAGEPVDLLVNGRLIARGEVVVIDENFGLRITELADSAPEVAQ